VQLRCPSKFCGGRSGAHICVWPDKIMQMQNVCHLSSCGMKSATTRIHNS